MRLPALARPAVALDICLVVIAALGLVALSGPAALKQAQALFSPHPVLLATDLDDLTIPVHSRTQTHLRLTMLKDADKPTVGEVSLHPNIKEVWSQPLRSTQKGSLLVQSDATTASAPSLKTIVLDPGHGGSELGAVATLPDGSPLREKDANLGVALVAAGVLRANGYNVVLTRSTDTRVNASQQDLNGDGAASLADDLQARVDLANRVHAVLFVSIHNNSAESPQARGTEVIYSGARPFSSDSQRLARSIHAALLRGLRDVGYDPLDLGVTTDQQLLGYPLFVLGPASGLVARPSDMPAALGESLFVSNPAERDLLSQNSVIQRLGQAYAEGIMSYFR